MSMISLFLSTYYVSLMSHKTDINLENLTCLNRIWHKEYDESLLSNWGLKSARNLDINLRNGKTLESFGVFGLPVEIDLNHCDDNGLATGRRMLHSVEFMPNITIFSFLSSFIR